MKTKTLRSLSLVVALFVQAAEIGITAGGQSPKFDTSLTIFGLADRPVEVPPAATPVADGPEEVPPAAILIADGPEEVPPSATLIADGPEEVPPSTLLVG